MLSAGAGFPGGTPESVRLLVADLVLSGCAGGGIGRTGPGLGSAALCGDHGRARLPTRP
jgi:hypothetical protein